MKNKRAWLLTPVGVALAALGLLLWTQNLAAGPPPEDLMAETGARQPHKVVAATAWSSGWRPINRGQTITFDHNQGLPPEQLGVEVWFQDTDGDGGINRATYGGLVYNSAMYGAYWRNLTANTIQVQRLSNDNAADQILVRVWAVDPPDYDSGWRTLDQTGQIYDFDHNLHTNETDLVVSMWFSSTLHGIHHFSYGGLTDGADEVGAYWMRLTNNSVQVYRRLDDANVEQVRVVVVQADPPDYDSLVALGDWQAVAPGSTFTFTHNLNWDPNLLIVRSECYDTAIGGAGIHQLWAGGDYRTGGFRGAHIQNLTASTVRFVRRANDMECDRARVRVWRRAFRVYLPLVVRNY